MLSARLQDAVGRLKDLVWLPKQRRFAAVAQPLPMGRCQGAGTRVRAGLHFDGVLKVQSANIKRGAPDAVVSLLAIRFTPKGGDDPGGMIELVLAGGGAIRLTVECIDAELADLTGPGRRAAAPAMRIGLMARRLERQATRASPRAFEALLFAKREIEEDVAPQVRGHHRRGAGARRRGADRTDQQIRPGQHHARPT